MMTLTFFVCGLLLQAFTPEAIEHAQAGAAARQAGQTRVAIQEFRKLTELQPKSAVAHADLGDAYFQNGEYGAAVPELELALQLNTDQILAHQTLGVILLMQGNAEGALPHFEKTRTPELMGLAYLETGRLDGAITILRGALEKQPDDPNLLYYYGRALALASKRTLDQVAGINPELARQRSGVPDNAKQNQTEDVVDLQNALAKRPKDADVLLAFNRAAALASTKAFDRILQTNPNSARAHQVLAERFFNSGRLPEAEREYGESLGLKPNTSKVHAALGDVLAAEGKRPEAVAQYRMETQLQPLSADAFYRLGAALLQQGEASNAIEELGTADRLKPNTPYILLALGGAAFNSRNDPLAEASWTKLLAIDKQSNLAAKAHSGLSMLYRRTGRPQDADREKAAYEQLNSQGGH
jgi:tetratricopeptide (TPR) repeat protein